MPKKYIDRELVINDIDNIIEILKKPPMQEIDKKLVETFKLWKLRFLEAATADVAEVVFCEDCKHLYCHSAVDRIFYCRNYINGLKGCLNPVEEKPYCSYGERKEK